MAVGSFKEWEVCELISLSEKECAGVTAVAATIGDCTAHEQ